MTTEHETSAVADRIRHALTRLQFGPVTVLALRDCTGPGVRWSDLMARPYENPDAPVFDTSCTVDGAA